MLEGYRGCHVVATCYDVAPPSEPRLVDLRVLCGHHREWHGTTRLSRPVSCPIRARRRLYVPPLDGFPSGMTCPSMTFRDDVPTMTSSMNRPA